MSDQDEKKDVVDAKKYNEAIETINSEKMQKEKLEKELTELKAAKETETKKAEEDKTAETKVEEAKKEWDKVSEEKDKMIEELKEKAEVKDDTKVSKGLAPTQEPARDQLKDRLNDDLGEIPKIDPGKANEWNRWDRLKHFTDSKTKMKTAEQFGRALNLHEGAITAGQSPLNDNQKDTQKKSDDIVLERNSDIITEGRK